MIQQNTEVGRKAATASRRTPIRSWAGAVTATALIAVAMAGCSTGAASTPSTTSGEALPLVVGVRNLTAAASPLAWAKAKGYFHNAGLDLSIVPGEAATTAQLVAGQTDLYWGSQGGLLSIANSNKPVSTIYSIDAGANGYVVTSNNAVKSPADCKTVTTATAGTVMLAWTKQLQAIYKVQWELTQLTTVPAIAASVVAARTDCAVGNISYYQSAIDEGRLRLVLDPGDKSSLPTDWPKFGAEDVVGGLPATLEQKKPAVEKFLKAYDTAIKDYMTTDPSDIAQTLINSDPAWSAVGTREVLAKTVDQFRQFLSTDGGYITKATWSSTLDFFKNGGLDFLASDPGKFDYSNAVDMSYYETAIGKP